MTLAKMMSTIFTMVINIKVKMGSITSQSKSKTKSKWSINQPHAIA
jgi:hypothetical protein